MQQVVYDTNNVYVYACGTFCSDFNLEILRFRLQSPNLMGANTNYSRVYYEAIYAQYHPACLPNHQMSTNFPNICSTNTPHIQYQ